MSRAARKDRSAYFKCKVAQIAEEQETTVAEIARRAGITKASAYTYARDPLYSIDATIVHKLLMHLGMAFDELFEIVVNMEEW